MKNNKEIERNIKLIKSLLDEHVKANPNHRNSCDFILQKYLELEAALESQIGLENSIEWSKLFAPRIIYDGIGNKKVLEAIEVLNSNFDT